jgi:hypothetical protein
MHPRAPYRSAAVLAFVILSLLGAALAPAQGAPPANREPARFIPYENESDVVGVGPDLAVENRLDRVTLAGSVDLTLDRAGLEKAEALRTLLEQVCRALRDREPLPPQVTTVPPASVDNPFD